MSFAKTIGSLFSHRLKLFAIIGSGLYWGSIMLRATSLFSPSDTLGFSLPISAKPWLTATSLVALLVLLALGRLFAKPTWQKALVLVACISNVVSASLTIGVFFPDAPLAVNQSHWLFITRVAFGGIGSGTLAMLWGLWFASVDRSEIGRAVISTVLFGSAVYLVEASLPSTGARSLFLDVALIASPLFAFALLPLSMSFKKRESSLSPSLFPFYLSRIGFGAAIGLCAATSGLWKSEVVPNSILSLALIAVVLVGLFWCNRKKGDNEKELLPLAPLIICAVIVIPLLGVPVEQILVTAPSALWVTWMILSAAQLSECKGTFGLNEVFLVATERITVFGSRLLVEVLLSSTVLPVSLKGLSTTDSFYLTFGVTFVALFLSVHKLLSMQQEKERYKLERGLAKMSDQAYEGIYNRISKDYQLTARESEVFALLARGHTRKYISETLFISDGTTRTHVRNIYGKLGCHTKEDLLALVERYRQ